MPFRGGSLIPFSPVILSNQTLDAGVNVGHFVYYDIGDSEWKKAGLGTQLGTGVASSSDQVTLLGKIGGISGLVPGKFVYASNTPGELTQAIESNIKIGYAISSSELLVDIKAEEVEIGAIFPKSGYFGGGNDGAVTDVIDKLIFATDTRETLTATLSTPREQLAACNSHTDGYFAGGDTTGVGGKTTIADKLVFAIDVVAAQATANLSVARISLAACNSPHYGYFAGGNTAPGFSLITDRLDFATDTTIFLTSADLTQERSSSAGCSSATVKNSLIAANRISFHEINPDEIRDAGSDFIKAGLRPGMVIKVSGSGVGNDGLYTIATVTAGVIVLDAGDDVADEVAGANVITIEYPNITIMPKHGYFAGGWTGAEVATTDKLLFATETTAVQDSRLDLTEDKKYIAACNSPYYGYFAGGYEDIAGAVTDKIDRLVFATDTTAVLAGITITPARDSLAGCNSLTDGYFGGGDTGALSLVVDKLSFATETVSVPGTAELSVERKHLAACQSGGL